MDNEPLQIPQKSTFVSVLAWVFIVLGSFATFISILQNIMIYWIFPKKEMLQAMERADKTKHFSVFTEFMFSHIDMIVLFILLFSATSVVSAIALLKRKNWARIFFTVLMSVGIVWNVISIIIQFTFSSSMPEMSGGHAPPPEFQNIMQIMKIASVIMVVGISALLGFVIKKLCSDSIKKEFA